MRNSSADSSTTWAAFVKQAREDAGLSQTKLAELMGINRNTIGRWESGKYGPDRAEDVVSLARATRIAPEQALMAAGFLPSPATDNRDPAPDPPIDPRALAIARDLQIVSDRLYAPDLTDDERIQIETQLDMLVDLARKVAAQRRART